jgi:tetratricopeptide (TPR) repeat protein
MGSFHSEDCINGRYRVLRQLGAGAMGTVYLCEDLTRVRRKVALKVLRSDRLEDSEEWSKIEYEALTRLIHPNLARVHDFGRVQESHDWFIVSEFIRGDDFLGASTSFEEAEFLDVIVQICRALEYIHSQGYVHFDIKPDNILVTRTRQFGGEDSSKVVQDQNKDASTDKCLGPPVAKLIDFGLAEKITGTFDFAIKGTMHYVAPEIIEGGTPDRRADLYSFGVSLYQIMCGRLPFVSAEGVSVGRIEGRWREDIRNDLSGEQQYLVEIIIKLLEKDPELRFSTAREIIQAVSAGAGRHWQAETAETQNSYLHSNRLIGRRFELEYLRDGVERNTGLALREGGDPHETDRSRPLLLVSGEIGIGKSRLIDEFSHHLKLREMPVFTGHCLESGQQAYQPFKTILEQMSLSAGLGSELFKNHGKMLQRLCPRLRAGSSSDDFDDRPEGFSQNFVDEVARFMELASREKPSVVVINNLHWADDPTVALLDRLTERILKPNSESKILVVLTMRDDDQRSPALQEFIDKYRDLSVVDELVLKRFGRPQIAELIQHVLQVEAIPATFLDRLEERTAGNPLFLVEMLKVLQEEGIIHRNSEGWTIRGGGELSRVELPAGIHQVLHRRVRLLAEKPRSLLRLLALHGKSAPLKLLEFIDGFKETLRSDLRELDARGMVSRSLDSGRPTYAILQPKLQEIIIRDIPPAESRRLHGLLAEGIEEFHSADLSGVREDLSYHFQRSDCPEKALEHLLAAGEAMQVVHAHGKALEHYQQALCRLTDAEDHHQERFAIREKMGDAAIVLGDLDLAKTSFHEIESKKIEREDWSVELEMYRVRALRKLGRIDEILGDYPSALRWLRESADIVMRLDEEVRGNEQLRVLGSLAWIQYCTGDYDRALKISAEGLSLLDDADASAEKAFFLANIGHASQARGEVSQAIDFHQQALEIHEDLEASTGVTRSLNALCGAYLADGQIAEALEIVDQVIQSTEESGDRSGRALALHHQAEALMRCGDLSLSLEKVEISRELSQQLNMRYLSTRNYLIRGKIRRITGDLHAAESDLLRAYGVHSRSGKGIGLAECLLELVYLNIEQGNTPQASDILDRLRYVNEDISQRRLSLEIQYLEACIDLALNHDPETSLEKFEAVEKGSRERSDLDLRIRIMTHIAELQVEQRKLDDARQSYQQCDRLHQAVSESLPNHLRAPYLESQQVGAGLEGGREVKEVLTEEISSDTVQEDVEEGMASESSVHINREQERLSAEMMRVTTLLGEAALTPVPRVIIPKSLSALVRAIRGQQGWILTRKGDEVHVAFGVDASGKPLKGHKDRIALSLVEDVWDSGKGVLARRIVDEPRTQTLESLYKSGMQSLCVMPLRLEGKVRALAYIADPDASVLESAEGKSLIEAHCGLMGFLLPRQNQTSTTA